MESCSVKPKAIPCIPILLLALLLAFPALSVKGAANGLLLWFQVVLPALAPFMICTQMIVALGGVSLLIRPFYPLFHKVFGLSPSGAYVLLSGLLCGYPLGARLCADFYRSGRISCREARYLLSICNHPSPMFLLGFVNGQLPLPVPTFLLPLCLYLPILPISWISRRVYGFPCLSEEETVPRPGSVSGSLESVLLSTAETMVLIGSYMMLFSILAAWIGCLSMIPAPLQALLSGVAEITTGIHQICLAFPPNAALLPVMAVTAFGGFSGIFQTKAVIASGIEQPDKTKKNAGLSIRHYVLWKLAHAGFACLTLLTAENLLLRLLHP